MEKETEYLGQIQDIDISIEFHEQKGIKII
jgi:hypothetical protein